MTSTELPEVGEEIPAFVRQTGFHNWNRYAAVNDEFVPIHMDDEAGQAAGYPTAFGMGNLQWSYLHNIVREWMGERGTIEHLSCQFRGPNLKGQTVTGRGRVTAVRTGPSGPRSTSRCGRRIRKGNLSHRGPPRCRFRLLGREAPSGRLAEKGDRALGDNPSPLVPAVAVDVATGGRDLE